MNNQTMKRIKESLVSSNTLDALGSDSCTVSTLSVRGPNSKDESDLLNAVNFKDDSESLAEASFAGDADENIMDPCAVCFTDRNFPKKATHFCDDCGLLGHFLCEQCLGFHKKFTNHKSVKSFAAAKYKRGSNHDETLQKKASEIGALQKEVEDLSSKLTEFEDIKTQLHKAKEQLKISEGQLEGMRKNSSKSDESKIFNLEADKYNLYEKLRQSEVQVTAKEHEIKTLKEEHEKMLKMKNQTLRQSIEQIKAKELEIKTLKDEHGPTIKEQDELSKVGANIMNDNPNITGLSDEYRPTKLSEKHCELYDNEWTDAYEEAENEFKNEEKGIAHLYKTLLDVFDFCKKKSEEHAKHIRDSVTTLPNAPKMRPKSAAIGVTNQRQLKEVRKSFAPMLIESVFQNYVNEKKLNFTHKKNTEKFIKKCVEICWLMNSQDPPVTLDTSVVDGKSFDVDKFRTYTKTGKMVDYVVWPPMLLHKGGPMLCKGVAQGK